MPESIEQPFRAAGTDYDSKVDWCRIMKNEFPAELGDGDPSPDILKVNVRHAGQRA